MKRLLPLRWLAPFCMLALAGCSVLAGSERHPVTLYAPQARIAANPAWPQASWQLAIAKPTAPSPEERQRWVATAAYHRAEKRGFAPGYDMQDWLDAEAEIDELIGKA